jgi:uncharacterized membrane protein YphA (DoxX/SURF4 family)
MEEWIKRLRATREHTPGIALRLIAGLPLLAIGSQHLIGAAPLAPIIRGTPLPFPELQALAGTGTEIVAGLLLVLGLFGRLGGLLGIAAMGAALFAHLTFEPYTLAATGETFAWSDEPPIIVPLAVLLASAAVTSIGSGRWSLDARGSTPAPVS